MEPIVIKSSADLERACAGSYEERIRALSEAVLNRAERLFGEKNVQVVATYPGYAIVALPRGKFEKVEYVLAEGTGSEIKVVSHREFGRTSGASVGRRVVVEEVRSAVREFISGKTEGAVRRLAGIVGTLTVEESTEVGFAKEIVGYVSNERKWKSILDARRVKIEAVAGASTNDEKNFKGLYDGSTEEDDLVNHAAAVRESLGLLVKRIIDCEESIRSSLIAIDEEDGEADPMVGLFQEFVADLRDEMFEVSESVSCALDTVKCVSCLAQVHDAVVTRVRDYEVASGFVREMVASPVAGA